MALRNRTLLAVAAGAALLGGCATYDYPYNGYNGYNGYGYNGYDYGPGPAYYDAPGYYDGPSVGFGVGFSDFGNHEWHGDRGRHDWRGGDRDHDHDGHGGDRGGDHDFRNDHGQHSGG